MKIQVVITAAGQSSRMKGVDKLTWPLGTVPLLVHTLQGFLSLPDLDQLVVSAHTDRVEEFEELFSHHFGQRKFIRVVAGGKHRQESILHALRVLKHADRNCPVMIHDGARPFVSKTVLNALLVKLQSCDGVIPALPVRDTVKRVAKERVVRTEDREQLRLVQTPQVFKLGQILDSHERAKREDFLGTDDASLLEHYGGHVTWIAGHPHNLKITIPEDLALLEYLLKKESDRQTS